MDIYFAYTSFKWANLAAHNAGVTVVVVGVTCDVLCKKRIFQVDIDGKSTSRDVANINAYLIPSNRLIVEPITRAVDDRGFMIRGNMPTDGGNLLLNESEKESLKMDSPEASRFIKRFVGAQELLNGLSRYCIWIEDDEVSLAESIPEFKNRIGRVRKMRLESSAASTRDYAAHSHKFRQIQGISDAHCIVVPRVSSENRAVLPVGYFDSNTIVGDRNFVLCDAPIWNFAILASRMHWAWVSAISARLEMRLSYANTLCWNTFPIPTLTEKNKADLTRCAEDILLAREAHFPATIADLYDPENMPPDLREAHERNDETLERIYIGRRFRNDTERLEKLFELYTKMAVANPTKRKAGVA
jgi:hypothetical protein